MRGKHEPAFVYWWRQCVGLSEPVDRATYAATGCGLMLLKYVVEWVVLSSSAGVVYTPLDFVNPLVSARANVAEAAPEWLGMAWIVWTLPFLWVALSMSVRRAADAGWSPWIGMLVLVPIVNLLVMIALAIASGSPNARKAPTPPANDFQPVPSRLAMIKAMLGGIAVGGLYASLMIQVSVYALDSYGATLFFGTPVATGAASAYIYNWRQSQSWGTSLGVALAAVMFAALGLLLFALEGIVCLVMAAPIMLPLAIVGGLIGKAIADYRRTTVGGLAACLVLLPGMAAIESRLTDQAEFMVLTAVEIEAPAEDVWQTVIGFPPIDAPLEWYFRLGIAAPESARLVGDGVGAIRYCNFTTGSFVEPITAWDAPRRLAFNVAEQPEPMFELTPYRHVHPPHLEGAFRSTRGEFRLVEVEGDRTRLEGRTWYRLEIYPHAYWTVWTDWILHRIHVRVLRHIKRLAEA